MTNKKQKYIITLLVDNREWNSQPIEGELGDLQSIIDEALEQHRISRFCLLYTSPSPRDGLLSRMPSSA